MSESPEEEPSPGVLGRIGSWFSPWKSQIPRDLEIENATKASEQGPVPDTDAAQGGAARAEPVREPAGGGWQRKEGTGARSSDPERSRLSRDLSSSTKEDAARSARRDGPFWSTDWEPAEPGPKEEEFVDAREFLEGRRGQGWEREGGGHRGTPLTGDPTLEHKASPLTPRSRARVLGAVGKLDAVHNPAQRNALNHSGKKLHVYLEEETSVINSGNNSCTGQEVVRVRLEKSFDVLAKTKSLDTLSSPRSSGPERREIRNRFCLSAPVDLELTAPSDTHRESPETESEETESDRMGRKNTSRRKSRKLSQGDVEGNSQENTPSKACQALSGSPSASGGTLLTQAPGVETHLGRAAGNSASSQSLSEGGKNKTSPTAIHREIPLGKQPKGHLGADTKSCTGTIVAAVDGEEDMDEKFKLERKTETAESKRKSIKVSRSEVKIFSKNVLVNADSQSGPRSGNVSENFHSGLSKPQDAVKDNSETEVLARKGNLGILEEEPKAVIAGRIADKISVFEGQRVGAMKKTFHTTRSADVSPIRAASRSRKEDDVDGGHRSKSEERLDDGRSSSAPPEKARTVKERARNIEACKSENKTPMSPKVAIRGMSLKTSSVSLRAVSKPSQLDIQDKQAVNEKTPTALISEIRSKDDGPDGTVEAVKLSGPEQLQADSGTIHPKELTEGKDLLTTKNNVESDRPVPADSDEHANEINPEAKTSSKTGTRSKKRRSRDLTSPPNGTKSDGSDDKPLLTSSQQEKVSASIGPCSPMLTLTDPGMVQSNKSLGKTAVEKHHATGSTQQVSGKTVQSPDKEPGSKDEGRDQLLKGQGGLVKSVTKYKGPDTDTSQRRTKQPSDVGRLPGKIDPVSDQKGEGVSKGNSKAVPSPTSSIVEQPLIEKPPAVEQGAPVAPVESEKPPSQAESKAKGSVKQQGAKTEAIDQSEDGCKQKNVQSKKNDTKNVPRVKDQAKENVQEQQLPKQQQISVDKVTTKGTASNSRETTTDTEKSKAETGKKGGDKPSKNTLNSEPNQSEAMKKASPPKQSVDIPALGRELPTANGGGVNERAAPADTHTVRTRLTLPRGLGAGDSSPQRDAPSSWLDVDFPKQRLRLPDQPPRLGYSSSESNLLDTAGELGDDDFVEKIKNLCAPFSMPPRKHSHLRPPQPPFAMPAIKEDRFEKTFDPDQFQFGLRKKTAKSGPSLLAKLQSNETKASPKPARASIADRCILLNSMDSRSRLRERSLAHEEKEEGEEERATTSNEKEEKKEETKVRSRLEGSSILSSLSASSARGKRTGLEALPLSGVSTPSEGPQNSLSPGASAPLLPSPTSPAPLAEVLGSHHPAALAGSSGTQAGQALVGESAPLLPSFNDIKLPDYLEKYLPREGEAGREQVNPEKPGVVMSSAALEVATEMKKKPGLPVAGGMLPCLPASPAVPPPAQTKPAAPSRLPPTKPLPLPHGMHTADTGVPKGPHRRPGKMVLFEKAPFGGQAYEVFRDLEDATALQLSPVISVRVVRGCWLLYESPGFRGRCVALEEGGLDLSNVWAPPDTGATPREHPAMLIGSIRLAVCDYVLPHIDLFTDPEGHGRVTPYHDDTVEMGTFGIAQSTASIKVHSGVWLVFSDPGYQGMLAVLETGEYPFPESWGFPSPFIGSLRPLKMGAFKVEYPNEVKAVLYESPGFEGPSVEIESDLFCFEREEEEGGEEDKALTSTKLTSVGSLKIIGGLWVGYSQPGFEGRQHVLEEGEYLDWGDWGGGSEHFLSLRPVQADFISPHLKMFTDEDFGAHGAHIDLTVPVPSMELTGYGLRTKSVHVVDGVWVVFEEPDFCGEAYVLEKGLYGTPEDWGAMQPLVASVMPIVLDNLGNSAKFKVHLFSKEDFQGSEAVLEDSAEALQPGFSVASCRVLAGSWLAFEGACFSSRMYVLEVGSYADRRAMGCVDTRADILSLQTAGFEFSLPSVTLFERAGLRGKRAMLTAGSVNLQLAGAFSRVQSVLVEGGMWVLYKEISYRGDQILLRPGEKQVYIRLRNRGSGLLMGVTGELEDLKLMRVQETEETGGVEQVWVYQDGRLRCKLLEECCLSPSGTMTMAGSRLGLSPEPEGLQHLWSISPDGEIHHVGPAGLLLDVKGGHNYDKNQVILSTFDPNKPTQQWDVEIV
ncbi:unnamed protein product [Arctogadus glacialis]